MGDTRKVRSARQLPEVEPALAYSIDQAARLIQISRSLLYEEIEAKRISTVHLGDRHLVRHEALVAYLALLEREQEYEMRWRR